MKNKKTILSIFVLLPQHPISFRFPKCGNPSADGLPKRQHRLSHNRKGKGWYEIHKDTQTKKWIIAKADLKVSYDNDPCSGSDVMIINPKHENAVLFFTPFEGLNEKPETIFEESGFFILLRLIFPLPPAYTIVR